jgi:tetratricopeptide (TPR) repeat protein
MKQIEQLIKFTFLFLALSVVTQTTHAKSPTVTQTGNIVHIKFNNSEYILFGDPGFETNANYQFEIPLNKSKILDPLEDLNLNEPSLPSNEPTNTQSDEINNKKDDEPQVDISALLSQANYLYNKSQYNEALKLVEHGVKLNPKSAKAWSMRGSLMYVLGNKEAAKQDWNKSLSIEPNNESLNKQIKELK